MDAEVAGIESEAKIEAGHRSSLEIEGETSARLSGGTISNLDRLVHWYKTDGEIPVHTHDDAGRQRSTTGKYFPYEGGVNTCFAPAVINTPGIFR